MNAATNDDAAGDGADASGRPVFVFPKARYILDTESTLAQMAAEAECAPFFVDLPSLPEEQLDHLRSVGLLPPLPLFLLDADDVHEVNGDSDDDGGVGDDGINTIKIDQPTNSNTTTTTNDPSSSNLFDIRLLRDKHISYLSNALSNPLSKGYVSLDSSHPWMIYWCLHSLDLLGYFDFGTSMRTSSKFCGSSSGSGSGSSSDTEAGERKDASWVQDVEILQKRTLLQRIVSTLQHCFTEVPVEFEYEEVVTDCRLRELLLLDAQKDNTDNTVYTSIDGDSSGGDGGGNDPSQQPIASSKKTKVVTVMGGGFGGGPQQLPHVATTYAAVLALSIVAGIGMTEQSKSSDDHPYHEPGRLAMELLTKIRLRLYAFFLSLREEFKNDNNKEVEEGEERKTAFRMHHDGEIDVRASYCILTPCYLLGLLNNVCDVDDDGGGGGADESNDYNPLLSPSIPRYIASCQTFEGGFGAEPFNEAHGGYTFCALAALRILNAVPLIDVNALSSWLARRQMSYEGGFCGRTNKLVDGCYSFWQGGAVAVLDSWLHNDKERSGRGDTTTCSTAYREISFDEVMLQRYILLCAQDVNGGLRDKPSKPKDFYHSCYNLSGLSVAQHVLKPWPAPSIDGASAVDVGKEEKFSNLFGDTKTNIIGRTDPVINIREERVQFMRDSQE